MHIPIIDIGLIALVAMALGILASRLKLSSAVGYILAGIFLGPLAFGLLVPGQGITPVFAEFGVLLIMFYLGLELNVRKFKETGAVSFVLAIAQMMLVFALGFLAAKLFGFMDLEAVIVGAMLVCTSTVMVAKFLIEKDIIGNVDSRIALSVLILQDFFAIFTLVLISSFSVQRSLNSLVLTALLFMVAVFFVVRKASTALLDWLHSIGHDDKMVFYAIGVGVVFSFAAESVELSPVLGAFFTGLALAETKYGERIKREMGLFREFFVLFFFVAFGTTVFYDAGAGAVVLPTLSEFLPLLGMSAALVAVYITGSLIAFTLSGMAMGMDKYTMSNVTMLLIPLGEFVIIIAAAGEPLFSQAAYAKVSVIAFLLILITAPLAPIMYSRSRQIMDFLFSLLPKQTQGVLNSIGQNFYAAESLVRESALKNELFKHVEGVVKNAIIMLSIVYISVLLKERFVSADFTLLPGITLSAFILLFITWPAYKMVSGLRRLVAELFRMFALGFFPPDAKRRGIDEHAVGTFTALLLTAMGVAAFAWTYYSRIDPVYLAVPGVYTLLCLAYLSRSAYYLLEGFESVAENIDGGSTLAISKEFDKHSRRLAKLNSKRIEAKEKAREAIENGDLKRARKILQGFKKREYRALHELGFARPTKKALKKLGYSDRKIKREEEHMKKALEEYFKNNPPVRTAKKKRGK